VPAPGKGGKGRANEFFSAGKPGRDGTKGPPSPRDSAEGVGSTDAPRGDEASRRPSLATSAPPSAGLSRRPPDGDAPPPPGQVRIESDPRAQSGEQTKVVDTRFDAGDAGGDDRTAPRAASGSAAQPPVKPSDRAAAKAPAPGGAPRGAGAATPGDDKEGVKRPALIQGRRSLFALGESSPPPKIIARPSPSAAPSPTTPEGPEDKPAKPGRDAAPAEAPRADDEREQKYERYKARLAEAPNDSDLLLRFASICADLGRTEEAIENFRAAGKLQPQNGFIRARLRELGADDVADEVGLEESRGPFSSALSEFLSYPFHGNGVAVLILGSIFFGIGNALASSGGIFTLTLNIAITGYFFSYQFRVLQLSAQGKKEPPDWPDVGDALGDCLRMIGCHLAAYGPALVLALCAILSWNANTRGVPGFTAGVDPEVMAEIEAMEGDAPPPLTGEAPAAGAPADEAAPDSPVAARERYLISQGVPPAEARRRAQEEFGEGGAAESPRPASRKAASRARARPAPAFEFGMPWTSKIFLLLAFFAALAGTAYFPLALLITAIFNSSRPAFGYAFGIDTARRIWSDYVICAGLYIGGTVAIAIISGITSFAFAVFMPIPILGPFLQSIISTGFTMYQALALSHLVGRLYYHNEGKIGWLSNG
jgi:tetratricopeptide (TPR) repeat protein